MSGVSDTENTTSKGHRPLSPRNVSPNGRQASATYRAARIDFAMGSDAELHGAINALGHELAACEELDAPSAAVARILIEDRLHAALDVRAGRIARFHAGAGPDPRTRFTTAWTELAERVKINADILRIFADGGYHLGRRGHEWAGACFLCGGHDRLVVFPEPDARLPYPRAWCRQCGGLWDAIAVTQNLFQLGFYDAVASLADTLGYPTPTVSADDPRPKRSSPLVGPVPIREGGRRGR